MWTLVKQSSWQQRLERPRFFHWAGGEGAGPRGWGHRGAGPQDPRPPSPTDREPVTSRSTHTLPPGRRPCHTQGQAPVITPDASVTFPHHRCVTSQHPGSPSGTNPHTWSPPPGQAVTDRHPVTPADSQRRGNWGARGRPPPRVPTSRLGPAAREAEGTGAASICRKHGYLQCFIFKPSWFQSGAVAGRGRVAPSRQPPKLKAGPEVSPGHRGGETEARRGAGGTHGHGAPEADSSLLAPGSKPRQGCDRPGAARSQTPPPARPLWCLPGNSFRSVTASSDVPQVALGDASPSPASSGPTWPL